MHVAIAHDSGRGVEPTEASTWPLSLHPPWQHPSGLRSGKPRQLSWLCCIPRAAWADQRRFGSRRLRVFDDLCSHRWYSTTNLRSALRSNCYALMPRTVRCSLLVPFLILGTDPGTRCPRGAYRYVTPRRVLTAPGQPHSCTAWRACSSGSGRLAQPRLARARAPRRPRQFL